MSSSDVESPCTDRAENPLSEEESTSPVVPIESGANAKRRRLGEPTWRALVEAFRHTSDHVVAAARVGVDRRTAKKAFEEGLHYLPFAQKPIKLIIDEERIRARHQLGAGREPTAAEVQAAQDDAIRARADEARMVRVAKANVLGMLVVTAQLVKGGNELAGRIAAQLKTLVIPAEKGARLLRDVASMARATAEAAEAVIKLERLTLGEGAPKKTGHEPMTVEEAQRELAEVHTALGRAQRRWGVEDAVAPLEAAAEALDERQRNEPSPELLGGSAAPSDDF